MVDGLDPGRLELLADRVDYRNCKWIVDRRIGGGLRAFARRQPEDVLDEQVSLVVRRRLLGEEQVLEPAREHLRRTAGRLDVEHVVALGDRRGRQVQQRRERPQEEVDVVAADQGVVVGDDGVLVARVVLDVELHLASEQTALLVDRGRPDLIALLRRAPRLGEVSSERQRDADRAGDRSRSALLRARAADAGSIGSAGRVRGEAQAGVQGELT